MPIACGLIQFRVACLPGFPANFYAVHILLKNRKRRYGYAQGTRWMCPVTNRNFRTRLSEMFVSISTLYHTAPLCLRNPSLLLRHTGLTCGLECIVGAGSWRYKTDLELIWMDLQLNWSEKVAKTMHIVGWSHPTQDYSIREYIQCTLTDNKNCDPVAS